MLLRHQNIYLSASGARTHALLIRNGEVVETGAAALSHADASDELVEPAGACIFPALCDAHIHLWGLGLRPGSVSVGKSTCTDDVYATLSLYDLSQAPGGWVLGRDWDQHRWSDADVLDIERLDALFPDHPLVLRRIDGHALWVNSAALQRSGIRADWDPGPNGHVGRSGAQLNGLLVDDAMNPVLEAIPEPTVAQDCAVFLESCALLRSHGCSSAHIAWMPVDRMQMLETLHSDGNLPLRIHMFLDGRDARLEDELARGTRFDDWMNVSGIKFFADGALGSRGAHLLHPYPDGSHGLVLEPREHLMKRCAELAKRGWQVAIHAIGDAAGRAVLDAFAAMDSTDRKATRPRMEHCQMLTETDVLRFGELGIVASIQAIHMHSDATWAVDELVDEQLDELFRWNALHRASPCLAGGSDYPIEDPNPWHGIATASSRLDRKGRRFRAGEALTRTEALLSYTEGAAWASHRETRSGKLEAGFLADFAVLDRDPLECTDEEIWEMRVLETWIGGSIS